jgi:hypothetical protein
MHSETHGYQVRDAAGERKPIEILSGVDYGEAEIFHTFPSPGLPHASTTPFYSRDMVPLGLL